MIEFVYEMKVPFYDVDMMGVVWHGNYVKYIEEARCDMFEKLNYTYSDMKADGFAYPVVKMTTKYIKPAYFDDAIVIKSLIKEIEPALIIDYEIYSKKTAKKIFKARTMQMALDIKSLKTVYSAPSRLREIAEKIK